MLRPQGERKRHFSRCGGRLGNCTVRREGREMRDTVGLRSENVWRKPRRGAEPLFRRGKRQVAYFRCACEGLVSGKRAGCLFFCERGSYFSVRAGACFRQAGRLLVFFVSEGLISVCGRGLVLGSWAGAYFSTQAWACFRLAGSGPFCCQRKGDAD